LDCPPQPLLGHFTHRTYGLKPNDYSETKSKVDTAEALLREKKHEPSPTEEVRNMLKTALHRISALLFFYALTCSFCISQDEHTGYLGLEIVNGKVVYTRRYTPSEISGIRPGDKLPGMSGDPANYRFFEFANDGCGNSYYVQLSTEQQDDSPVYFLDHEGGDLYEKAADSVKEFLSWKRSFEK
jgi:hypothetical protein